MATWAALLIAMAAASGPAQKDEDGKETAVRRARELLAHELSVPEAEVTLRSVEPVEWPDASLGCPEKGMQYAAVVMPGFRVVLGVGPAEYEVHVAGTSAVRCAPEQARPKADAVSRPPETARLSAAARRDLIGRLGVKPAEVTVLAVRRGPGVVRAAACPAPTGDARPPTHEIDLRVDKTTYRYEVRGGSVEFCGPLAPK